MIVAADTKAVMMTPKFLLKNVLSRSYFCCSNSSLCFSRSYFNCSNDRSLSDISILRRSRDCDHNHKEISLLAKEGINQRWSAIAFDSANHRHFASILSQIIAAISGPPRILMARMPVGE